MALVLRGMSPSKFKIVVTGQIDLENCSMIEEALDIIKEALPDTVSRTASYHFSDVWDGVSFSVEISPGGKLDDDLARALEA